MSDSRTSPTRSAPSVRKLGRDRVFRRGDRVVIHSPVAMTDWEERRFWRLEVLYEGERYFLASRDSIGGRQIRYVLEPWPDDSDYRTGKMVLYDEDFVRRRDVDLAAARRAEIVAWALMPFYPIIGLLPGRWKRYLETELGISAELVSGISIFAEFLLGATVLAMRWLLLTVPELENSLPWIITAAVAMVIDSIARYNYRLGEHPYPFGFYEWLFKR